MATGAKIRGITIEIGADTSKFKASLQGVNTSLSHTKTALRDTNNLLKFNTSSTDLIKQKQGYLKEAISKTNEKLKMQKDALKQLQDAGYMDKNKKEQEELKKKISETESKIKDEKTRLKELEKEGSTAQNRKEQQELKKKIQESEQELKEQKKRFEEVKAAGDTKTHQEAQRALKREIEANEQELKKLKTEFQGVATVAGAKMQAIGTSMKTAGEKMSSVGTSLSTYVTLPLAAVGTAAIKTTADFDESMSKVKAISGATGKDFEKLRDKAREMGSKTKFSASEAADGMTYMAMAGWKTEDMLDGLEGIMNLAAASGEDLATTSDIVTDALTAFGLSAKDSGHFGDVLAAASSNANTNVSMMGETFKYCAPVAGALGFSVEDTAVAIGLMANSGIKATQAGTSLRTILTNLSGEVKITGQNLGEVTIQTTNTDGSMRSLNDILADCRGAFSQLTESEKAQTAEALVGKNAMSGFLALMNAGEDDVNKLTAAIDNCDGVTQQMADDMQNNLSGQLKILKSQLEEVAIQLGDALMPTIKKVIDRIQEWVQKFSDLDEGTKETIVKIGLVVAAVGPLLVVGGKVTQGLGTIIDYTGKAINKAGSLIGKLSGSGGMLGSITSLITPIGLVTAAIGAVVAAGLLWYNHIKKQVEAEYGLTESQQKLIDKIHKENNAYKDFAQRQHESTENALVETNQLQALVEEYNSHIDSNGKVKKGYEERAEYILTTLAQAFGMERDEIDKLIDKNGKLTGEINNLIEAKRREALMSAYQESYKEALQKSAEAWKKYREAQDLANDSEKQYKKSIEENGDKLGHYSKLLGEGYVKEAGWYLIANAKVIEQQKTLKNKWEESSGAVDSARETYEGYTRTVKNYEGVQSAIITNDNDKIQNSLLRLQYDFKTTETSNRASLEQQVKDYNKMYQDTKRAIQEGAPGVTTQTLTEIERLREAARLELAKNTYQFIQSGGENAEGYATGIRNKAESGKQSGQYVFAETMNGLTANMYQAQDAGSDFGDKYSQWIRYKNDEARSAGEGLANSANSGASNGNSQASSAGSEFGNKYASGVSNTRTNSHNAGTNIANAARNGAGNISAYSSGQNFGYGYANGIGSVVGSVVARAQSMVFSAINAARAAAGEASPSKVMRKSGINFGEGYRLGIEDMIKPVSMAAEDLVGAATSTINDGMKSDISIFSDLQGSTMAGANRIAAAGGDYSTTTNMGGVTINITGSPGQDVNELADLVQRRIANLTARRQAVFS